MATSILARMGYARVTQARDGQEALDHIAERGGPDAFDFILMDLHMPRKVPPARWCRAVLGVSVCEMLYRRADICCWAFTSSWKSLLKSY